MRYNTKRLFQNAAQTVASEFGNFLKEKNLLWKQNKKKWLRELLENQ